jgi:hypothetical protein
MAEGLPLAIKTLETAPTYLSQVLQSLLDGNTAACQRVLDTLAKSKEGYISRNHHQRLAELHEQDFTPFRKLMPLAIPRRDCDVSLLTDADRLNWSSGTRRHKVLFSSERILRIKVALAPVSCKRMFFTPTDVADRSVPGV